MLFIISLSSSSLVDEKDPILENEREMLSLVMALSNLEERVEESCELLMKGNLFSVLSKHVELLIKFKTMLSSSIEQLDCDKRLCLE